MNISLTTKIMQITVLYIIMTAMHLVLHLASMTALQLAANSPLVSGQNT